VKGKMFIEPWEFYSSTDLRL